MSPQTQDQTMLPIFAAQPWQMAYGERAALEGLLSQVRPQLAVEIGTAEGGSLRRISAHSAEVHSFDLVAPFEEVARLANVTFHTGDSHQLLGEFLQSTAKAGRPIDFVLVDGDHSADGVRRDIVDVLGSPAVTRALIVLHDTLNPEVRSGIEAARIADHPKVSLYELDLIPGYLARREPYRLQMWGGLGLIVVSAEGRGASPVRDDRFHELFAVVRPAAEVMAGLEASGTPLDALDAHAVEAALRGELAGARVERDALAGKLAAIEGSRGWRLVAALREVRQILTERR